MADSYAQLLDALGFNAADAAQQTGQTQRSLEFQQSQIRQSGEDQRDALEADAEARGIISSGEYEKRKVRQRSEEAGALSQSEIGAADRLSAIQRELQRSKAQAELSKREQSLAAAAQQQSMALAQQQAQSQYDQYMQLLSASQVPATGGISASGLGAYLATYADPSPLYGAAKGALGSFGSFFRR